MLESLIYMPRSLIHLPLEISAQLREQLRRLLVHFEDLPLSSPRPGGWLPPVDLCEMPDAIVIRVEVPGVAKEDISLSILDNVLKIEGSKQRSSNSTGAAERPLQYICLERAYGKFERTIALQWGVDVEKISARLKDGLLEIRLPKAPSYGREVPIPISS